ncbi:dienelactone hydrolase [Paraburkholderia sp. MM5496-R1]
MRTTIEFKRPDGETVQGYLAEPEAAAGAPAVVVIQEWWGLNRQIRGVADRLAAAGYRALVPDLYRGKSTVEVEEAHHLMSGLNFSDAAAQDVRGALQYLKATGSAKVGVTGYCMGGGLTVLALSMAPEADAGVVWYGYPPLELVNGVEYPRAPARALGDAGRRVRDRWRRRARAEAPGSKGRLHRPPLPRAARLRERDSAGSRAGRDRAVRRRVGADGLGPHPALLRPPPRVSDGRPGCTSRARVADP